MISKYLLIKDGIVVAVKENEEFDETLIKKDQHEDGEPDHFVFMNEYDTVQEDPNDKFTIGDVFNSEEWDIKYPPSNEELAQSVRAKRDEMLSATTGLYMRYQREIRMNLPHVYTIEEIDAYAKELADIPQSEGFPGNVVFPVRLDK